MIQVLSDTCMGRDSAGVPIGAVVLVMDDNAYEALSAAVEVAFEDDAATPTEYKQVANELWEFFHRSSETPVSS